MNPHRTPGEIIPNGRPLDPGPAQKCQACGIEIGKTLWVWHGGINAMARPRACTPAARVRTGLFARCKEPGEHLHEHCRARGHRWITAFAGNDGTQPCLSMDASARPLPGGSGIKPPPGGTGAKAPPNTFARST